MGLINKRRWISEEERYLKQNFGKISIHQISIKLQRSRKSIYNKAQALGILGRLWSAEDDKLITQFYPVAKIATFADLLGSTPYALQIRAAQLGVKRLHYQKETVHKVMVVVDNVAEPVIEIAHVNLLVRINMIKSIYKNRYPTKSLNYFLDNKPI